MSRKSRKQCKNCPWKVDVDPRDIPNGYCVLKHANLGATCRSGSESLRDALRVMACHETPPGKELPCVGWLDNQLRNNNLGLRLAVIRGRIDVDYELVGPQHARFEDTLPRDLTTEEGAEI